MVINTNRNNNAIAYKIPITHILKTSYIAIEHMIFKISLPPQYDKHAHIIVNTTGLIFHAMFTCMQMIQQIIQSSQSLAHWLHTSLYIITLTRIRKGFLKGPQHMLLLDKRIPKINGMIVKQLSLPNIFTYIIHLYTKIHTYNLMASMYHCDIIEYVCVLVFKPRVWKMRIPTHRKIKNCQYVFILFSLNNGWSVKSYQVQLNNEGSFYKIQHSTVSSIQSICYESFLNRN